MSLTCDESLLRILTTLADIAVGLRERHFLFNSNAAANVCPLGPLSWVLGIKQETVPTLLTAIIPSKT